MENKIVFWQRSLSPHMTDIGNALCEFVRDVIFIVETDLPRHRVEDGMIVSSHNRFKVIKYSELNPFYSSVCSLATGSINICQGIRNNGEVSKVLNIFRQTNISFIFTFEQLRGSFLVSLVKLLIYRFSIHKYRHNIEFALAIGLRSRLQLRHAGLEESKIADFSYFVSIRSNSSCSTFKRVAPESSSRPINLAYLGRVDKNKNLDLLIRALADFKVGVFTLHVIGDGPELLRLQELACNLGVSVTWHGMLPMPTAHALFSVMDRLVLPSLHDGWGVVVSESLISGVPVLVSDAAGSAIVATRSPLGLVFKSGDVNDLRLGLRKVAVQGFLEPKVRRLVSNWSIRLTSLSGACYLFRLLTEKKTPDVIIPPWEI